MTETNTPTQRSVINSNAAFIFRASRLICAILAEAIYTFVQLLVFPFRRRAERARIRSVILGSPQSIVLLAAFGLFVISGCRATHPGTSFQKQVDETAWSARELASMKDAQGSLEEDLQAFGSGTSIDGVVWDMEQLFLSPDARTSLEDDLREFGDFEPEDLPETFEMLGW